MKSHPVSSLLLRTLLGTACLIGNAAAHPGHDFTPSAATATGTSQVVLAIIVASLALCVTRGIYRKLP